MKPLKYSAPLFTTSLDRFQFIGANRKLHTTDGLRESLQTNGYIPSMPITVNKKLQVIDGQNRLSICQELGIGVWYVVAYTANAEQDYELIIAINKNMRFWQLVDYIHHYATRGVKFHTEVKNFEEKYRLNISNSITLCGGEAQTKNVRSGKNIKLNPKREKAAEFILDCKDLPFHKSSHFVRAVARLHEKASENQLKKLKSKIIGVNQQPTVKHYLSVFENLINRNLRGDNAIVLVSA